MSWESLVTLSQNGYASGMTTELDVAALQAAVAALEESLTTAEAKEAAARTAHAAAKQIAGHYRQQLHFARVRLSKATMIEDKAEALRKRMNNRDLSPEQRAAAEEAYFRELDKVLEK